MRITVWISAECELPAALASRIEGGEAEAQAIAERVAAEAVQRAFAKASNVKVTTTGHADWRATK
jgi:hypothetical protein